MSRMKSSHTPAQQVCGMFQAREAENVSDEELKNTLYNKPVECLLVNASDQRSRKYI